MHAHTHALFHSVVNMQIRTASQIVQSCAQKPGNKGNLSKRNSIRLSLVCDDVILRHKHQRTGVLIVWCDGPRYGIIARSQRVFQFSGVLIVYFG